MLTGTIRPTDTRTLGVQGHSLAEVSDILNAQTPARLEVTDRPVRMENDTLLTATATFARRDGHQTVEAADMTALRAMVPDGYTLVNVRSA